MRHLSLIVDGIVLPLSHRSHLVAEVALHHQVVAGGSTFGHDVVGHIRNGEENVADFVLSSLQSLVDSLVVLFEGSHLCFHLFSLLLVALLHEGTNLRSHLVELCSLIVAQRLSGATFSVEFQNVVDCLTAVEVLLGKACNHLLGILLD